MGTDRKAVAKARKKTQMLLDEREHEFLRRGRERDAQKPEAAAAAPAAKGKKGRKGQAGCERRGEASREGRKGGKGQAGCERRGEARRLTSRAGLA